MGLLDEVNKISQQQNAVLTQRQQKAKLKEQKDFLEYLTQKCRLDILNNIKLYPKEYIIDTFVEEYRIKLNNYDYFDKTLIDEQYLDMIEFVEKQYKKLQTQEKSSLREQQKLDFEYFQMQIVIFFENYYQEKGIEAFFKLNECKQECLNILGQSNSYKAWNFYDVQNKKLFNRYKQSLKTKNNNDLSFFKCALIGTSLGLIHGFKKANIKNGRW